MPALSPTMTQGNVGAWQKAVGDKISPGDALVEIETDKATMDFEFQEEGYLAKIILETGTKDVLVGKPIAVYVDEESDVSAFAEFTAEDAADADQSAAEAAVPQDVETKSAPTPAPEPTPAPAKPAADSTEKKSSKPIDAGRIFASPAAKTIALQKGINLNEIKGTGPDGRIIKRDVENYKPSSATSQQSGASAGAISSYEDTPISSMRKTIATRLKESKATKPDYIVSSTVSVSKLLKLRASLNAGADGQYKLSVNDILVKAIAVASQAVPQVNSAWLENEGVIRQYKNVDVSVAVATPTGLITPVVKNIESKGLVAISKEIKRLGKSARDNKLTPEEYQGGTITISNMGMNPAVSMFTAIINPPQSAILAVGTVERRAIEDPESETGIAFDDVMTLTASFDHKVVDGAVGAEWIKALKKVVENPLELLL